MRSSFAAAVCLLWAGAARAQPPIPECQPDVSVECLITPQSVVVAGSAALEPLLIKLSAALKKENGTEIFYLRGVGQCQAAQAVASGGATFTGIMADYLADAKAYGALSTSPTGCCLLPFFRDTKVHLWVGDSAGEDCFDGKLPADQRDFLGPNVAYSIVAPASSPDVAITAEEAYFVFGFGSAGYKSQTVKPWSDQMRFAVPGIESGAQALWAKFLRLPAVTRPDRTPRANMGEAIKGRSTSGAEKVVSVASDAKSVDIGLTSSQAMDGSLVRPLVKPLAVQAYKQKRAFYPDSTSRAFDKRNVRDGRYPFWAPIHLVTKADATGRVLSDRVDYIIQYIQGTTPLPGVNMTDAVVKSGLVPTCAMKVQRAKDKPDTGELMPYLPPPGTACGCYMDELVSRGSSGCDPCGDSKPCSGGRTCSNGFCE
jgi:hypothetical protein